MGVSIIIYDQIPDSALKETSNKLAQPMAIKWDHLSKENECVFTYEHFATV